MTEKRGLRRVDLPVEERLTRRRERVGGGVHAAVGRPEEALELHRVVRGVRDRSVHPLDDHRDPVGRGGRRVVGDVRRVGHVQVADRQGARVWDEPCGRVGRIERRRHDLLPGAGLEAERAGAVHGTAVGCELGVRDPVRDLGVGQPADVLHDPVRDPARLDAIAAVARVPEAVGHGVREGGQRSEHDHQRDDRFEDGEPALAMEARTDPPDGMASTHVRPSEMPREASLHDVGRLGPSLEVPRSAWSSKSCPDRRDDRDAERAAPRGRPSRLDAGSPDGLPAGGRSSVGVFAAACRCGTRAVPSAWDRSRCR